MSDFGSAGGETRTSLDGYKFELHGATWRLNRNVAINLRPIKSLITHELFEGFIRTLVFFAEERSAGTVFGVNQAYLKLHKYSDGREIDCGLLIAFRKQDGVRDHELVLLRTLFAKWLMLRNFGSDLSVVELLKHWRLRAAIKGDAVKRLDPMDGPFSDSEIQALLERIAQSYEAGNININQSSLLMLLQATGRRRSQLTSIKLKDLLKISSSVGSFRFFVNIPRVKQLGIGFRHLFRRVEVIEEMWDVLQLQRNFVISRFAKQLGCLIPEEIIMELPLYFSERRLRDVTTLQFLVDSCFTDYFHMHRDQVGILVDSTVRSSAVISERTGELLKVTPTRFRYTLATRAAREGYGVLVIAELLDHSNIQNAVVYTQNVPEHAAHIDFIIGNQLAPYARAFAGTIVDDKALARRGREPGSDVRDASGKGAGTCGHGGACGAAVPVPCYTCLHFQAWLEGPHEQVYAELIRDREEVMHITGDAAVAGAHDRTIIAVAEVIEACKARKKLLEKS